MPENKEVSKEIQKEILKFQNYQRQLQMVDSQLQRLEIDLAQVDAALTELEKAKGKTFKAVGTILIEEEPKQLKDEMTKKREDFNGRIKVLKTQAERLQSKLEESKKVIEKSQSN